VVRIAWQKLIDEVLAGPQTEQKLTKLMEDMFALRA